MVPVDERVDVVVAHRVGRGSLGSRHQRGDVVALRRGRLEGRGGARSGQGGRDGQRNAAATGSGLRVADTVDLLGRRPAPCRPLAASKPPVPARSVRAVSARYQAPLTRYRGSAHSRCVALSLLGPLQVDGDGRLSPRDRVVLSALVVHGGDMLCLPSAWPTRCGERRRRRPGPRSSRGRSCGCAGSLGHDAIETTTGGYRLALGDDEIDIRLFERLVDRGRRLSERGEHGRAAVDLRAGAGPVARRAAGRPRALAGRPSRGPAPRRAAPRHRGGAAGRPAGRRPRRRGRRLCARRHRHAQRAPLVAAGHGALPRGSAVRGARHRPPGPTDAAGGAGPRPGPGADRAGAGDPPARTAAGSGPQPEAVAEQRPVPVEGPARLRPGRRGVVLRSRRRRCATACARCATRRCWSWPDPSGCGKSSMVRAGLVPALVAAGDTVDGADTRQRPRRVAGRRRRVRPTASRVLVVDQLEELFTAGHPVAAVNAFLDKLVALASSGGAGRRGRAGRPDRRAVLVAGHGPDGGARAAPGDTHVGRRPCARPSRGRPRQAGLRIEHGLVELLVREIEDEPGALPLLSHALAETWARREAGVLTVDGYRVDRRHPRRGRPVGRADVGVAAAGAAGRWYATCGCGSSYPPPDGDPTAVRLPLSVAAPDADRERVVDLLVRCRLVTTDDRTVSVAHEAVIRAWPRLRSWLDEDSAGLLTLRHLSVAAEDWDAGGRPDSELYRGARLDGGPGLAGAAARRRSPPSRTPSWTPPPPGPARSGRRSRPGRGSACARTDASG